MNVHSQTVSVSVGLTDFQWLVGVTLAAVAFLALAAIAVVLIDRMIESERGRNAPDPLVSAKNFGRFTWGCAALFALSAGLVAFSFDLTLGEAAPGVNADGLLWPDGARAAVREAYAGAAASLQSLALERGWEVTVLRSEETTFP